MWLIQRLGIVLLIFFSVFGMYHLLNCDKSEPEVEPPIPVIDNTKNYYCELFGGDYLAVDVIKVFREHGIVYYIIRYPNKTITKVPENKILTADKNDKGEEQK